MDEKGGKQVDVLDVQPAAAAREQIAAAVFEGQLRLHKTMLARFLPPIEISVEVPLCIVEHQTFIKWTSPVTSRGRSSDCASDCPRATSSGRAGRFAR